MVNKVWLLAERGAGRYDLKGREMKMLFTLLKRSGPNTLLQPSSLKQNP